MAQRFLQGATVSCNIKHLVFNDSLDAWQEGDLDVGYPKVTIWNPAGTKMVDAQVMSSVGTGRYRHIYALATDAPVGFWKRLYEGQYSGADVQKPLLADGFWVD